MHRPRSYSNLPRGVQRGSVYRSLARTVLVGSALLLCFAWLYAALQLSEKTQQVIDRQEHRHSLLDQNTATTINAGSGQHLVDYLQHVVWWFAPFLSGGGYSSEANSFVLGLLRSGYVRQNMLWITQHGDAVNDEVLDGLSRPDRRDLRNMMEQADYLYAQEAIVVCHSEPGAWALPEPLFMTSPCPPDPKKTLYKIGRTMFETDRLSAHHVSRCNMMDEIWVPTEFHRKVFASSGVLPSKLQVIGEAVDVDVFDPNKYSAAFLNRGVQVFGTHPEVGGGTDFVFLSVFKWEPRKGWDVLLSAFLKEFSSTDHVALYLKTMPYHSDSDYRTAMRQWARKELNLPQDGVKDLPRVYVIGDHIPQSKLPSLYKAADAFVLPSRGEGWGRPHVEAMAMGLPVIATNWSGPTAFLHEDNGYPLRVDKLVPLPADSPFAGHMWAEPSVTHLGQLMRHIFTHREEAAARGRAARISMQQNFTPKLLAQQIALRLQQISKQLPVA